MKEKNRGMGEVHVCRGTGRHYRARVKYAWGRHMAWLGPKRTTLRRAMADLVRKFDPILYNYGDVVLCSDWYSPERVLEMKRK